MELTLNQVFKILEKWAEAERPLIQSFSYGDPKRKFEKDILYPLMIVHPTVSQITENAVYTKIAIVFLDRLEKDSSNIEEVYSDMFNLCKRLKAFLQTNTINEIIEAESVNFESTGDEINSDLVAGWGTELELRLEFDPSVCENILTLEDNIIQIGNGGGCDWDDENNSDYLTCDTLMECSNLLTVLSEKANLSGADFNGNVSAYQIATGYLEAAGANINELSVNAITSGGTSLQTIIDNATIKDAYFNTDNNIVIISGGTPTSRTITHNLKDAVNIKYLTVGVILSANSITGTITNSNLNFANTNIIGANQISATTIDGLNILSGGTNINQLFSAVNHLHSNYSLSSHSHSFSAVTFSALTSTAHTHSISEINNLSNSLNTKSNTSGNTSFSSTTITASTYYSGATPLSSVFLLSSQTDICSYRKIGSTNLERWYTSSINSSTFTTSGLAKDVNRYVPLIVSVPMTIDMLSIEVTTSGSTGSVARIGIYNCETNKASNNNMLPKNVVLDAGTVAIDSIGVKSISSLNTTLAPGLYYLTVNNNSALGVTLRGFALSSVAPVLGISSAMGISTTQYLSETFIFNSFSASTSTFAAVTTSAPVIAFRLSA